MRFLKGIQRALEVSVRFFKVTMRFPKLFGTWRLLLDVTFQICEVWEKAAATSVRLELFLCSEIFCESPCIGFRPLRPCCLSAEQLAPGEM